MSDVQDAHGAARPPRLTRVLLAYMTLVTAAITLIPFQFRIPSRLVNPRALLSSDLLDVLTNVVLFVPLGFLAHLSGRRGERRSPLLAVCFGVVVSVALEAAQTFVPGRYPQIADVATNGFGAWVGAAAAAYLRRRRRLARADDLVEYEFPLMNLVYLLTPLLWLNGLSIDEEPYRLGLSAILGVVGASILASVYANSRRGETAGSWYAVLGASVGWFVVGAVPLLISFPLSVMLLAAGVGAFGSLASLCWRRDSTQRRFEHKTLRLVLPIYLLYIVLLSVWPTTLPLREWAGHVAFTNFTEPERIVFTCRFIELIVAFTLLGFMIAEARGRKQESPTRTLSWVIALAWALAVTAGALRDGSAASLALFFESALFVAAALYGGIIYRVQLSAIRRGRLGREGEA